jgi:flavodoxin I
MIKIQKGVTMKILITYLSQTGNTEKIAKAIYQETSPTQEVEIKKLEEVSADNLSGYDLIFIGSPIHAGNLSGPVKEFLGRLQAPSGKKMAGLLTHAGTAYPDQVMSKFTEPFKTACEKNGLQYLGCFSCQGFLNPAIHEMVKKGQNLTDEQWAERVKEMTGHPDAEDLKKARAFAKEILLKI